jgi:hypothetical protein
VNLTTHFRLVSRLRLSAAIPLQSLMPLSLQLGYEAGMLAAQTIISIVKLREPTELMSERDGSHDLFLSF